MCSKDYLEPLLSQYTDKRTKENIEALASNIIEHKSMNLWHNADDRAAYARMRRLIDGQLKATLNDKTISAALLSNSIKSLSNAEEIVVLHDPCSLRKPYASDLENIGKVRSLDNKIINGYETFNSVFVDVKGKSLRLLESFLYSNGEGKYITKKELEAQEKLSPGSVLTERQLEIKQLLSSNSHHNLPLITRLQLKKCSQAIKTENPERKLTHVLDRGFDDSDLFDYIADELNDHFVIRLKSNRLSNELDTTSKKKGKRLKLTDKSFAHSAIKLYPKLMLKKKVYQDVKCHVSWEQQSFGGKDYSIVKIQLIKRNGKDMFKQPMLLVSNHASLCLDTAFGIFQLYLKRSKIEGVFKFLKETLGWENFQIRDFESIKTLVAFCYFIVGYFYEIGDAYVKNDFIKSLADLGHGKGKVTRYYILLGLERLLTKISVDQYLAQNNITPEQIEKMLSVAKLMRAS